jgi:MFS family permease
MSAGLIVAANLATIALMPRFGPRPLVASGMLAAAGGAAWLAQLGPHTGYPTGVLGPLLLAGAGVGMVIAPAINTGTFGVAPHDAGVASATVTVGQMLGGSVGTALLNTIFASAVAAYLTAHLATAPITGRPALTGLALAHGYDTAFWWTAGIFATGAVIAGALLRRGPLVPLGSPSRAQAEVTTAGAETGPALVTAPRANRLIDLRGFLIHYPVLASARSWAVRTATIMADRCTGVRSASIGSTQSPALPRYPSVATVVEQ